MDLLNTLDSHAYLLNTRMNLLNTHIDLLNTHVYYSDSYTLGRRYCEPVRSVQSVVSRSGYSNGLMKSLLQSSHDYT